MKAFLGKTKFSIFNLVIVFQLLLGSFLLTSTFQTAYAQTPTAPAVQCGTGFTFSNGTCVPNSPVPSSNGNGITGATSVMDLILRVLKILLTVVGVIAVVLIVVSGFQYMTAGGNEEQAEKGRKGIINAAIGLIVVILAYTIVAIITRTLTQGVL